MALGARTYLEIVGPDPDQPAPDRPRWFGVDTLPEPRLVTWAAGAADIEASVEHARRAGIGLGTLREGRRTRTDGVELVWRFTDPASVVCDGVVPFLIDWGTSPHPAASAPDGGALVSLRAEHPDPVPVERCLQVLEVEMVVERGRTPALVATIRTRRGDLELR